MQSAKFEVQSVRSRVPVFLRICLLHFALCALTSFSHAAVIKSGMMLNIVVKNDKDLSQIVRVNDNGTIDYPLYQDISVVDKTTSELQDILTYKLAKVVESPMVLVSVMTENSHHPLHPGPGEEARTGDGPAQVQPAGGAAGRGRHHGDGGSEPREDRAQEPGRRERQLLRPAEVPELRAT